MISYRQFIINSILIALIGTFVGLSIVALLASVVSVIQKEDNKIKYCTTFCPIIAYGENVIINDFETIDKMIECKCIFRAVK